jgi:hypothetical protein
VLSFLSRPASLHPALAKTQRRWTPWNKPLARLMGKLMCKRFSKNVCRCMEKLVWDEAWRVLKPLFVGINVVIVCNLEYEVHERRCDVSNYFAS